MSWISVTERLPDHMQEVRTKGTDGREYDCVFLQYHPPTKGYFKLIGKVWDHDNVTHWMRSGK
jgi:hypothetical protein